MSPIQYVTYDVQDAKEFKKDGVTLSSFAKARSFNEFDINFVDMQCSRMWRNKNDDTDSIDSWCDIQSVGKIISASPDRATIILFPGDYTFKYYSKGYENKYYRSKNLKDMLGDLQEYILRPLCDNDYSLKPGIATTLLNNHKYESPFTIEPVNPSYSIACKSVAGQPTVIRKGNLFLCPILLLDYDALNDLLVELGLEEAAPPSLPEWLLRVSYRDEEDIRRSIQENEDRIAELKEANNTHQDTLEKYRHYKSILCNKDKALEDIVKEMLAEILEVKEAFIDYGEEDYSYLYDDRLLLFEIKGSTKNLKRDQINKTDSHVQIYRDNHEEDEVHLETKGILIFSGQIEREPIERDPYPKDQVTLAKRNQILVIPAEVFLRIHEEIHNGTMTKDELLRLMWQKEGVLEFQDLPTVIQEIHAR